MDDLFEEIDEFAEYPEKTKDEWIEAAKKVFKKLDGIWIGCHEDDTRDDDDLPLCGRCGGMLYIEQGGETVDCTSCKGRGVQSPAPIINVEMMGEEVYELMNDGQVWELLGCKILTPNTETK